MADVAREIVKALNDKPFERSMTLVKLDELKPIQLLQLLNDVFASIAPDVRPWGRRHDRAVVGCPVAPGRTPRRPLIASRR